MGSAKSPNPEHKKSWLVVDDVVDEDVVKVVVEDTVEGIVVAGGVWSVEVNCWDEGVVVDVKVVCWVWSVEVDCRVVSKVVEVAWAGAESFY